jgi:hypothetical protein
MLIRSLVFLGLMLSVLRAQLGTPYQTVPPLREIFPAILHDTEVRSSAAFLLNLTRVVPAGSTLRTFYLRPVGWEDASVTEKSISSVQYMQKQRQTLMTNTQMNREKVQWRKLATESVWPKVELFRIALETLDASTLHLVFVDPSQTQRPDGANLSIFGGTDLPVGFSDEPFQLPDGMFLAETAGAVTVLAVEKDSVTMKSGLQAGDQLRKIGDQSLTTLADFLHWYPEIKSRAKNSGQRKLPFTVQRDQVERIVDLPLQVSLQSSFMDQPIESGPTPTHAPR